MTEEEKAAAAAAAEAERKAKEEEAARKKAEEDEKKRLEAMSENERKLLHEVMEKKAKVTELTGLVTATKTELDALKGQLKEFEGIDVKKVRDLLAAQKTEEEKLLEAKGEFGRLKERIVEEHTKELETIKSTIGQKDQALSQLQTQINDLTIGTAFQGSKFVAENLVLTPSKARVVYGQHFEIEEGQVVAYDKPKGASTRTKLVNGRGDPMPFDDAIGKLVEMDPDRDRLVKSKLAPGAGSNGGSGKGGASGAITEPRGRERIAAALLARKK